MTDFTNYDTSTIAAEMATWLRDVRGYRSEKALSVLIFAVRAYLAWLIEHRIALPSATVHDVGAFVTRPTRDGRRRADATRAMARQHVSLLYQFLMTNPERWFVVSDPAHGVRTPSAARAERATPNRVLTPVENEAMRRAVRGRPSPRRLMNTVIVDLLALHGLRPIQVVGARVRDVRRGRPDGSAWVLWSKVGRSRPETKELFPDLARLIASYLRCHRSEALASDPLLVAENGRQLSTRAVQRLVKAVAVRAGLDHPEEVTPYSFRKGLLADARDAGLPMAEISGLAGHHDEDTTRRYLRNLPVTTSAAKVWAYREEVTARLPRP